MNLSNIKQIVLLRRKSLIALLVLLSSALAIQLFVSLYQKPRVETLRLEWQKMRELEIRGATLQNRDTLYKNGLADLARFRDGLYQKNSFARFIGELYGLADKTGLDMTAITYKPTFNKDEQLLEYQLAITVSGKYQQLKRFINDIVAVTNFLVIDSVMLASGDSTTDTVQLQIQITSFFKMEGA